MLYSFIILALSNPEFLESSTYDLDFFFQTQSPSLRSFFGVLGDDIFSSNFENQLKSLLRLLVKLHRDLF
jgi:hypothetical protein